jgi:SNF2 family DNA or RNA helicase
MAHGVVLRPYQKQSLAFMLGNERAPDAADTVGRLGRQSGRRIRGGWLADEVGMGKTVIAISLILANPLPVVDRMDVAKFNRRVATYALWDKYQRREPQRVYPQYKHEDKTNYPNAAQVYKAESRQYERAVEQYHIERRTYLIGPRTGVAPKVPQRRNFLRTAIVVHPKVGQVTPEYTQWVAEQPPKGRRAHLKATLIIAPPTLAAQWSDEVRKFAPHLRVLVNHSTHAADVKLLKSHNNVETVLSADVIIMSSYVGHLRRACGVCRWGARGGAVRGGGVYGCILLREDH